ncbi:hypothetical protein AB0C34_04535 [Nocardia sp. NPDC049220]
MVIVEVADNRTVPRDAWAIVVMWRIGGPEQRRHVDRNGEGPS